MMQQSKAQPHRKAKLNPGINELDTPSIRRTKPLLPCKLSFTLVRFPNNLYLFALFQASFATFSGLSQRLVSLFSCDPLFHSSVNDQPKVPILKKGAVSSLKLKQSLSRVGEKLKCSLFSRKFQMLVYFEPKNC